MTAPTCTASSSIHKVRLMLSLALILTTFFLCLIWWEDVQVTRALRVIRQATDRHMVAVERARIAPVFAAINSSQHNRHYYWWCLPPVLLYGIYLAHSLRKLESTTPEE